MTLQFRCEKCHKTVKAPDSTTGKRGKCPDCGNTSYIPSMEEPEEIPLAPIDEESEQEKSKEIANLLAKERDLLHEMGGEPSIPLEHKEDLNSEDLHHFVVNYCLDMYKGELTRAEHTAKELKKFKFTAIQAVEDFQTNRAVEPALGEIKKPLLDGFLKDLKKALQ